MERGERRTRPHPIVEQFVAAFSGRMYAPLAYRVAVLRASGASGAEQAASHIEVEFRLRARERPVLIEASREPARHHRLTALSRLVFDVAGPPAARFPIVIERGKTLVRVDGRRRAFTTYTAACHAVANARVGDVDLQIRGPSGRLPELELVRMDDADLEALLRRHPMFIR
jgi:hypothetical protein